MTPTKFKVGDRVAVYGGVADQGSLHLRGSKGTVTHRYEEDINVKIDGYDFTICVHPKQCRLLKRKERRLITVERDANGAYRYTHPQLNCDERVCFVEVRKGKEGK